MSGLDICNLENELDREEEEEPLRGLLFGPVNACAYLVR